MPNKEACSGIEQQSVLKFLVAERCKAVEIRRKMSPVYGATCFIKNKHKEQTQGTNIKNKRKKDIKNERRVISQKESFCIVTMQGLTQQPKRCRPSTTWAGNCFFIFLTAQTLPLQTFTCLVPWKSSREAQSLKVTINAKVLWMIGWDISLKIFMLREYESLCADGENVWNWWETMLKKIKLLSEL